MDGLHIIAELHACRCPPELLHHPAPLRALCLAACDAGRLSVVAEVFHAFGTPDAPAGATGAVVLAESHLTVHTWPELSAVTLDLYVCNFSRDNREAAERAFSYLERHFDPGRCVRRDIERGRPGDSANDSPPSIGIRQTS
jgi:S-adenosylmethionine decarboxylase proenzyme